MAEMTTQAVVASEEPGPRFAKASEIKTRAKETATARQLPQPPGKSLTFKELMDWLDVLSADQWNHLMIYVYRVRPVIIRQLSDPKNKNYIDVLTEQFTEQELIDRHGGGKYQLRVNDTDSDKTLCTVLLEIPWGQYSPKLNYEELDINARENLGYIQFLKAQGKLDERGKLVKDNPQQQQMGNNGNDAMVQAMKLAMDFASKMSQSEQNELKRKLAGEDSLGKNIGEILLEQMKQQDPNKMVTTLATLMSAMKGMQPQQDNTLSTIMPMFMTMMQNQMESQKQQFTMMVEMMKAQNPAKETDEVERLKSILEIAREIKGGGGSRSTAEVVTEAVTTGLASIGVPVLNIVSQVMSMKAAQLGNKLPNQPTTQMPTQQDGQMSTNQPTQQTPAISQSEISQALTQFAPLILANLNKEGYEFAEWVANGFPNGDAIIASISRHGIENIIAGAKTVPEFWQQIATTYGEEYLRKWFDSFINYKTIIAELEDDDNQLPQSE